MNKQRTPNQRYTAKLRKAGMQLYPMWMPADGRLKARVKKYKDAIEKEFLRNNRYDPKLKQWVSIRG